MSGWFPVARRGNIPPPFKHRHFRPHPHGQRPPPSSSKALHRRASPFVRLRSCVLVSVHTRMPSMDTMASSTVISDTQCRAPTPLSAETTSRASFDTSTTVGVTGISGPAIAPGVFSNVGLYTPLLAHRKNVENVDTEGVVEDVAEPSSPFRRPRTSTCTAPAVDPKTFRRSDTSTPAAGRAD